MALAFLAQNASKLLAAKRIVPRHNVLRVSKASLRIPREDQEDADMYNVNPDFAVHTGFGLVLERATNVVKIITERRLAKVLHIHCGGDLVKHFGESRVIALDGCTDDPEKSKEAKKLIQYSEVRLVNFEKKKLAHIRPGTFQFVLNIVPIGRQNIGVPIDEMLRVTNHAGYCILGVTNDIFERENMLDQIKDHESKGACLFLSLQKISCPLQDSPNTEMDYALMVFRKGNQLRMGF